MEKGRGHITCESEPGKGSDFVIYFPAVESTQTPDQEIGLVSQSAVTDTILVVEDVSSVAELTSVFLYQCRVFGHCRWKWTRGS